MTVEPAYGAMEATNRRRAQACRIPEMDDSAMRLSLHFSWRRGMLADAAVSAYSEWRDACAAVRASYRQWAGARREEERSAFIDYQSALDREEHAAKRYARLVRRAGHLGKTGVVLQLARIPTDDGSR
jgi:hypothetical protein